MGISIHAPAWGRDWAFGRCGSVGAISIHAPAWGRDDLYFADEHDYSDFNPRARMGARLLIQATSTSR